MFSPPEFDTPPNTQPGPVPLLKNRAFGMAVLVIAIVAIAMFALSFDSGALWSYNASQASAATATASSGGRRIPGLPPGHPPITLPTPEPYSPRDLRQGA